MRQIPIAIQYERQYQITLVHAVVASVFFLYCSSLSCVVVISVPNQTTLLHCKFFRTVSKLPIIVVLLRIVFFSEIFQNGDGRGRGRRQIQMRVVDKFRQTGLLIRDNKKTTINKDYKAQILNFLYVQIFQQIGVGWWQQQLLICRGFVLDLRAYLANSSNNSSRSLFLGIFPTKSR